MKFKKLYAAALAAGICFVSAAAPVSAAIVAPDGTVGNGWAQYTVEEFYDSDKDVTEVKSFTFVLGCDVAFAASGDFNGQLVVQNTVDWAWNQKTFSADTSVNDFEGKPYDFELVIVDESTAEVTIPCEGPMALFTLQDKIGVGNWNDGYTLTVKDVKFNFGDAPAAPAEQEPADQKEDEKPADQKPEESSDKTPTLPKTGLVSGMVFFAAGSLLTGAGVVVAKGKKEK